MQASTIPSVYHAVLPAPFACLGILVTGSGLAHIVFLARHHPQQAPTCALSRRVWEALQHYLADPCAPLDLPLEMAGTAHQIKVWRALQAIPPGRTTTYGALASQLGSSPRAVGQACASNPLPIIVPCHRVLARHGRGGFMHAAEGAPLAYKDWLLEHESGIATGA